MENKFKDNRAVKLENVLAKDFIPMFAGRPVRAVRIGKDDFLDLKIVLNTTASVEEFIRKI